MRKLTTIDGCMEIIRTHSIEIFYTNLDGACRGFSRKYGDGYLIVVEQTLCLPAMARTIQHELAHVFLGHLEDDERTEVEKESEVIELLKGEKNDLFKMWK